MQSDPICSSAGWPCDQNTKKFPYPINYKVPNFGVDEDIINTQKHISDQEKAKNHVWKPKQDENGAWIVPKAHANGSYTYKKPSLAQLQSDPVCHSAGCPKSKWFGKENKNGENILYPDVVDKFGYDEDIIDSVGSEMSVTKKMNRKLNFPTYT